MAMMTEDEKRDAARTLVSQAKAMLAGAAAIVVGDNWPDPWSQQRAKEYLQCAVSDCDAIMGLVPR